MSQQLHNKYPAISDLEYKAKRRIPHFAWEYLDSGTGVEDCVPRNRAAFSDVILTPKFMQGVFEPETKTSLFGVDYDLPFGVAPVGLTGLMWPAAEKILAKSAAQYRIPYTLSTVATEAPESIAPLVDGMGWFQLYPPRREALRKDILKRAKDNGFTTLVVTADVPTGSTRERQTRAGVTVPPKTGLRTVFHSAMRPRWTMETLRYGQPAFRGLEKYLDAKDMQNMTAFMVKELGGSLDWDYLKLVRDEWDGPIVLKGILDVEQAKMAVAAGLDGVVVSNHGGRQCDGVPASLHVLPEIKAAVGDDIKVLFDSGVRTGLDIIRAIALGADFVLLGRPFMYGVAALGHAGGNHVIEILSNDLRNNMSQLGCRRLDEFAARLRH
ncbi:alpha-hydroxy acid oxidase [Leucothrix pacifica]|uniref:Alpha-hydroxy-acid oxidizing enzyme n=1 Tax=Leucothrix pacifica TaxID=1247513 RepID=A0A317CPD7_9GAMM|nr:alpha-hydroxy acid oxidase [Leucothrix pacifica]PWR00377.1 alpha-hydroxy-acid oxidizing enzyme [Leucothrix pacifica]